MIKTTLLLLSGLLAAASLSGEAKRWDIDQSHSDVSFKIRHFFTQVPGTFNDFDGYIVYDPSDPSANKAVGEVTIGSVDTRNEDRDEHIMDDGWLSNEETPVATFTSTRWEKAGEGKYKVTGDLELAGTTEEVTFDLELLGTMENPRNGKLISGWVGKTTIDRDNWGVTEGKPAVGGDVEITINIEAVEADA
jgi:polyisoprenoid-binding protein YceI